MRWTVVAPAALAAEKVAVADPACEEEAVEAAAGSPVDRVYDTKPNDKGNVFPNDELNGHRLDE